MAAAAAGLLLRFVASKMWRGAAPTHHHHHRPPSTCLVARHGGGARSGPATSFSLHSNRVRMQGPRMAHAPWMAPGFHSSSSSSISPASALLARATGGVGYYIAVFGAAIYAHFWYRDLLLCALGHGDATGKRTWLIGKLGKEEEEAVKMRSLENHVKELDATIMGMKAQHAELKIALESVLSSQGN